MATLSTPRFSWTKPAQVFFITRIMASAAAALSLSAIPAREILGQNGYTKPMYGKLMELLIGCWERSDGIWYLGIARSGYVAPPSHAFMPLYPALIRAVDFLLPFPSIVAALLVVNLAFFLGLHYVYCLAWSESSRHNDSEGQAEAERTASRTLWYLALFPGSVFFFAPYTESVFLCMAAATLWKARTGKWAQACVLGAFLGVTRNLGWVIALPLLIEFVRQRRMSVPAGQISTRPGWTTLAWFLLLPTGLMAWTYWCDRTTGDPLIYLHQQSNWGRHSMAPWKTFAFGMKQAWDYCLAFPGGGYVLEAIAVGGAALLGIMAISLRKLSLPLSAFLWLGLIPPLLAPFEGRMLMSCARFVAVLFPAFIVLAKLVRSETTDQTLRITLASLYGIAVALYVSNQYLY